jgi:hypothetical protein
MKEGFGLAVKIAVECYAGYRANETPRRFRLDEQLIDVVRVIDRWTTPDYRYFRVEGGDGGVYVLRVGIGASDWEMVLTDAA